METIFIRGENKVTVLPSRGETKKGDVVYGYKIYQTQEFFDNMNDAFREARKYLRKISNNGNNISVKGNGTTDSTRR